MTVRLANQQDKNQVLALFDEFSAMFHSVEKPSKVGGAIFDEIMSREDTMIFIAEKNNTVQGLVTFYLLPNVRHGWHRGHIEDFY